MQAFEAAARHLSFTRAADELHLTQAAISHQVKMLEKRLRVRLFSRSARTLGLTPAGHFLYQPIRSLLSQMEHMVDSVHELAEDELVVYAPPCIGAKWLMPRIKEFRRRHSNIHLRLNIGDSPPEMMSKVRSVSIAIGPDKRDNNTRQEFLQNDSIFPVCSPKLIPAEGLQHVSDLKRFELLEVSASRHYQANRSDWLSWLSMHGEEARFRTPALRFGDSLLAIQAAIAGSGIALARGWVAEPDLLSGSLVKPLDMEVSAEEAYYLVYPRDLDSCEQVICFREWLFEAAGSPTSARHSCRPKWAAEHSLS
jgi:LysR family transcriptional regulator, glycine cleavage system transcriptional activator